MNYSLAYTQLYVPLPLGPPPDDLTASSHAAVTSASRLAEQAEIALSNQVALDRQAALALAGRAPHHAFTILPGTFQGPLSGPSSTTHESQLLARALEEIDGLRRTQIDLDAKYAMLLASGDLAPPPDAAAITAGMNGVRSQPRPSTSTAGALVPAVSNLLNNQGFLLLLLLHLKMLYIRILLLLRSRILLPNITQLAPPDASSPSRKSSSRSSWHSLRRSPSDSASSSTP
jgi:hypothetical protein